MKPAAFEYHAPATLDEALELLREHGFDAKALAGGQSLIPAMNFRLARPAILVDLNGIEALSFIRGTEEATDGAPPESGSGEGVRIGAMTRQRAVERSPLIGRRAPLLTETLPHVAHPQIRNRGTIGGSAVHADPASEIPAVLLAMNAKCRIRGPEGERTVAAEEFFLGLFGTVLAPDELLVEIELPGRRPRRGCAFREIARRHGDYAMAGIAASLTLDEAGAVDEARLAYLSVGGAPLLAGAAAEALLGREPTEAAIREAARVAADQDAEPMEDMHASAAYRARLVEVLTRQALTTAARRANGRRSP